MKPRSSWWTTIGSKSGQVGGVPKPPAMVLQDGDQIAEDLQRGEAVTAALVFEQQIQQDLLACLPRRHRSPDNDARSGALSTGISSQ